MSKLIERREFLRHSAAVFAAGSAASLLPQLSLAALRIGNQGKAFGNYRALVCVYLAGGNDSWNLLVPHDNQSVGSLYDNYRASRGGVFNAGSNPQGLGLDFNALQAISPTDYAANSFGLHPQCADYVFTPQGGAGPLTHSGLASLFNTPRKLALLNNIGTLIQPLTKAQYLASPQLRPPQLFSHNDQELQWNLARNNPNHPFGWGGEVVSRVDDGNGSAVALAPCISVAGSNRFQVGPQVFPYQMSNNGAVGLGNYFNPVANTGTSNFGAARRAALNAILSSASANPFAEEYRTLSQRSINLAETIGDKLLQFGAISTPYQTASGQVIVPPTVAAPNYPAAQISVAGVNFSNSLLDQLRTVARMIRISRSQSGAGLNQERQIYYVRLGGFDTHDTQMANAGQPLLMARINQALAWFWQELGAIGAQGEVTTFSMSEFARTLSSNGNGSDHGWGGVQFALGGAVQGGKLFGAWPSQVLNGVESFDRGQTIPALAVDQFAASLAVWLGVPPGDLPSIFPNIGNFSTPTIPNLLL